MGVRFGQLPGGYPTADADPPLEWVGHFFSGGVGASVHYAGQLVEELGRVAAGEVGRWVHGWNSYVLTADPGVVTVRPVEPDLARHGSAMPLPAFRELAAEWLTLARTYTGGVECGSAEPHAAADRGPGSVS